MWFSDESKFNLVGSDGKQYCRRRQGEEYLDRNIKKTVKHGGGSLMVWGWTGRLHRVKGTMNASQYCNILTESLLGSLADRNMHPESIVFQQDNDPKHTSRKAWEWFDEHGIETLPWPPSSPDMNIIEHAWALLDSRLRSRHALPRNLDELWAALVEEWEAIDVEEVHNLYRSLPRRTAALKDAKGGYTHY